MATATKTGGIPGLKPIMMGLVGFPFLVRAWMGLCGQFHDIPYKDADCMLKLINETIKAHGQKGSGMFLRSRSPRSAATCARRPRGRPRAGSGARGCASCAACCTSSPSASCAAGCAGAGNLTCDR